MALVRVGSLPPEPLAAAAAFYTDVLPQLSGRADEVLILVFAPADHTHHGWRTEAVAGLARAVAPRRINGLAGDDEAAITAAAAWLEQAPGVTGQMLRLSATS